MGAGARGRSVALWSGAGLAAAAVAALASVGATYSLGFQSDDVAQVLLLRSWRDAGLSRFYAGSDTLLLRAPITWLVEVLVARGPVQLRLLVAVLVALTAMAVVASLRWRVAGRPAIGVVGCIAVCWLFSTPGVAEALGRPLVRNVELGAAVLGLVGLDRLVERPPRRRARVLAAVVVPLSVLLWNDPYLTYLVAFPAAAVTFVSAAVARSGWRAVVGATLLIGVAGSRAVDWLAGLAGIEVAGEPVRLLRGADYDDAWRNLLDEVPLVFGASHRSAAGVSHVAAWGNRFAVMALLTAAVVAAVAIVRRWRSLPVGAAVTVLLVPLPLVAWVASSNVLKGYTWRFAVLTPFALVILVPVALAAVPADGRRAATELLGAVLLVAMAANLEVAARRVACGERCTPAAESMRVAEDRLLAASLGPAGVRKLFAPYWRANIVSYGTGGAVPAVAIDCQNDRVLTSRWLTTETSFMAPTPVSHLLAERGRVAGCERSAVEHQLGPPLKVAMVGAAELWSYQGDLSQRLPSVRR